MLDITIAQQLEHMAECLPDKTAFLFPDENLRLTFSEVSRIADKTAKALLAMGLEKGDRIGIWSTNCSRWIALVFGAAKLGVIVVPLNTCFQFRELEDFCVRSDLNALFVMGEFRGVSTAGITEQFLEGGRVSRRYPCLRTIVLMDPGGSDQHMGWGCFLEGGRSIQDAVVKAAAEKVTSQDIYLIQYTSGTTEKPKGVMLKQYGVMNTSHAYVKRLHFTSNDITCVLLPLFHCFGNALTLLGTILSGSTTIYQRWFKKKEVLPIIEREKCTAVMGVPTMYFAVLKQPDFHRYDLHTLVKGGIGGACCPAAMAYEIAKGFGMDGLVIGYGLSETASLCTLSDIRDPACARLESVGFPLEGLEVALADPESGVVDTERPEGELVVRGYSVMSGYDKDPEATRKALDPAGWLHTGDLGRRGENGVFHVIGRIKDMIIRGGENISPSRIEEKLLAMENVQDCQCVGVPDPEYGEEIAVFLISKDGREITADQVTDFLKTQLTRYELPRYVLMTESFPQNGVGKVLKTELARAAVERIS